MLPFDSEFILLYSVYLFFIFFLLFGLIKSNDKKYFIVNSIIFLLYTSYFVIVFTNEDNFQYGGSLVVLCFSGLAILLHIFILIIIKIISDINKNK